MPKKKFEINIILGIIIFIALVFALYFGFNYVMELGIFETGAM